MVIDAITDFGPNADEKASSSGTSGREGRLHRIIPVILDCTEQPPREIVLQPTSVSCVWVEERVRRVIRTSVQEVGNDRFHPGNIVAPSIISAIE